MIWKLSYKEFIKNKINVWIDAQVPLLLKYYIELFHTVNLMKLHLTLSDVSKNLNYQAAWLGMRKTAKKII